MTFKDLGLKESILESISKLGFETPSPIQEQVIPYLLNNESDIVGLAQTGTGKTAAFGLPLIHLAEAKDKFIQGLVLAPTRELCVQIATELKRYSTMLEEIRIVAVYGGEDIRKQLKELDRTPHILVATPGRLIDLKERGKVDLSKLKYLVLDEADEMLNMGFLDDITNILSSTPEDRRTLLFSATMPKEISNIAKRYMKNPIEISVGQRGEAAKNVEHYYVLTKSTHRYDVLKRILDYNPDIYGIVFCRTRQETKDVAEKLMIDGYNADALHGDLSQVQRDAVMNKFRIKHLQILVATDVAARGLDVNDLSHVVHYVLPDDKETYTHRSGRTGRINKSGVSIAIVTPREKMSIKSIEKEIKRTFSQMEIPTGMAVCQRQLMYMVEKMQTVEKNEKLHKFLPDIYEQLKDMDKEEVISRFVSLAFNPILDYYQNAQDLNALVRKEIKENRRDAKKQEQEKLSRREMRKGNRKDMIRLKINRGKKDKMDPRRFLGMINEILNDRSIEIGNIDITSKFTFFDFPKAHADKLMKVFMSHPRARGIALNPVK